MLDIEDNAFEYIKEAMIWDLNIKIINTDDGLQW